MVCQLLLSDAIFDIHSAIFILFMWIVICLLSMLCKNFLRVHCACTQFRWNFFYQKIQYWYKNIIASLELTTGVLICCKAYTVVAPGLKEHFNILKQSNMFQLIVNIFGMAGQNVLMLLYFLLYLKSLGNRNDWRVWTSIEFSTCLLDI